MTGARGHDVPPGVDPEAAKKTLLARRAELVALSEAAADSRKAVELDQQSIGRLSRQDALQQQAMAKAQDARRAHEIRRIDAALKRLAENDYGWCVECGAAVAPRRLEIDPCAELCVACAR
ncbi:TraR/DksA family transcriptional regulator [Amphiplicatus metriothermophilus]|uniref:Transcriptional regulator, TraR/DksA family n=1 Tax=Amphiplicatus metriothermophilus TaxID=1519374 RepID=A0A239Q117_9PROT|nr:TraR/DksA family transcriptional regulator [Amphiplicatus metriothermophilus]MBB5520022.1 DnaK suppressor protein [Amphiplicatus metriothermophilus]SNT76028.1 transcriptional regulator, TraR/DksA family [Amphiplicatus metriothermophilus]